MSQSGKKKRTADAGRRVINGRVYDSKLGETCHWCRQKTVEDHVYCSRCPIRFCGFCLANRHGELILEEMQIQWVCPRCRGGCGKGCNNCCNCGPCRKAQDLAPTGCVIHRARLDGFGNVHDYLVYLVTNESCQDIARRKAGKQWTKEGGAEPTEMIVPTERPEKISSLKAVQKRSRSRYKAEVESDWSAGTESETSGEESALECLDGSSEEDDEAAPTATAPAPAYPEKKKKEGSISHLLREVEDDVTRHAAQLERQKALRHASLNKKKKKKPPAQTMRPAQPRLEHLLETPIKVKQEPDWETPTKVKQEPDWEPDVEDEGEDNEVAGLKSVVQELSYKELLQEEMDRHFDPLELDELLEEVSKRKPAKRHMETRRGTRLIETRGQGMSYLDYHPDLSSKLSAAVASSDKLKLLRGFFFWIKHTCKEGAFKPWTSGGLIQEEDCQLVDGFDCEITSVVVSLDAKHKQRRRQQQQPLRRVKVKTEIE